MNPLGTAHNRHEYRFACFHACVTVKRPNLVKRVNKSPVWVGRVLKVVFHCMKMEFLTFQHALNAASSSPSGRPAGITHYNWAAFIPSHHPAHCSSSVRTALRRNPLAPQRTSGVRTDPSTVQRRTNSVVLSSDRSDSLCVVRVKGNLPTCCVSLSDIRGTSIHAM